MAVLKKIKFGTGTPIDIQFTEVKPATGGVITANPTHTSTDDGDNPEYEIDLTIADDGTLVKENGALKVGTVPAAQVSVAAGGHNASAEPADNKTFVGDDVEEVLLELNQKIERTGNVARTYTLVDDTKNDTTVPANVAKRYRLQETIGSQSPALVGANIDIPKDSSLKEVYLGASTDTIDATTGVITKNTVTDPQSLNFAYQLADGTYSLVKIDVSKFLTESEFGDGLAVSNTGVVSVNAGNGLGFDSSVPKKVQVVVDSTSETDGQATHAAFLTVGADGVKVQGIKTEIARQIAALDNTDTADTGKVVTAVSTADGIASPTKADLAGVTLGGFTQDAAATGAIADTDTLGAALNKLENKIDAAADDHTVVEHASGNTHVTVAGAANANGGMTYTVTESDIASAQDLAAEIAARKAVDGQSGQTYTANTSANYISDASSLNDADVKLDAALKAEETRAKTAEGEIASKVGLTGAEGSRTFTPTTNYGTGSTTIMGNMQALDTQLKTVSDNLSKITYSVSGTTLTFNGISQVGA